MDDFEPIDPLLDRYQQASKWLLQLREDEPTTETIAAWLQWCDADPENRAAFEQLLPLWCALDDPKIAAQMAAKFPAPRRLKSRRSLPIGPISLRRHRGAKGARLRHAKRAVAVLVSAVIAAALWGLYYQSAKQESSWLTTSIAQKLRTTLPDGSVIALGPRSTLGINFHGRQRRVDLAQGEAYFRVRHNAARPFIVRAGELRVRDLGTAFDVLRTPGRVVVAVKDGRVEVTAPGGSGKAAESVKVVAGQQLNYVSSHRHTLTLRAVDPTAVAAWRNGLLEYIATPLSVVISDINRYSRTPVVLSSSLTDLRYTGTIEVADIHEWLRALPRIFPVRVQFKATHRIHIEAIASRPAAR